MAVRVGVRDDGAIEFSDGTLKYEDKDGFLHRNFGPAIIKTDGYRGYFSHGLPHRVGFPSIIYENNRGEEWHENGLHHRIGGPSVSMASGYVCYHKLGKLHNLEGPARLSYGTKEWFVDGVQLTEEDFNELYGPEPVIVNLGDMARRIDTLAVDKFGRTSLEFKLLKLGEEIGEVMGAGVRHVEGRDSRSWIPEIEQEMCDVFMVALQIAHELEIDLGESLEKAVDRFENRVWPTINHQTNQEKA